MTDKIQCCSAFPLHLVLFAAGSFFWGLQAGQVKRIISRTCDQIPHDVELMVSIDDTHMYRVSILSVEDIVSAAQGDIIPFPPLIEPWAIKAGMWAILQHNNKKYFLLDFRFLTNLVPAEKQKCTLFNGEMTITKFHENSAET